jgi:hypothetical protein
MGIDEAGETVRSLRSYIVAPAGRPTELETSMIVSPSIKISVGPSNASLRPRIDARISRLLSSSHPPLV